MADNLKSLLRTFRRGDLLLTPRIETWLMQHPEGIVLDASLAQEIGNHMVAVPRDRTLSWSASAIGNCHRHQVFTYVGLPGDPILNPRLQNLFNDGTWRHLRWQAMLLRAKLLTHIEVPVFYDPLGMRGTMDGVNMDEMFGFELKGVYSLSAVKDGPYPKHLLQVHAYFLATTLEKIAIIYEDKQTQEFREFVIERDERLLKKVRKELLTLNTALAQRQVPDVLEECRYGKGPQFKGCAYRNHCLGITDWDDLESLVD